VSSISVQTNDKKMELLGNGWPRPSISWLQDAGFLPDRVRQSPKLSCLIFAAPYRTV